MTVSTLHGSSQTSATSDAITKEIDRMLLLLKVYAGFTSSQALRYKLDKIFSKINPAVLSAWVDQLHQSSNKDELNALVEDLTNHETFFFREKAQLDVLSLEILPKLLLKKINDRNYTLRLWSSACSTGEEPYTLAIIALRAFVQAGIAREIEPGKIILPHPWKLEVIGTDISRQALKIAQNAIYTNKKDKLHSFRQCPEQYMRFFNPVSSIASLAGETSFQVNETVRRHVKFSWFNLKSTTPPFSQLDIVFCRNVLIYFEKDEHALVQSMLSRSLAKQSYLFLGMVDTLAPNTGLSANRNYGCTVYEN